METIILFKLFESHNIQDSLPKIQRYIDEYNNKICIDKSKEKSNSLWLEWNRMKIETDRKKKLFDVQENICDMEIRLNESYEDIKCIPLICNHQVIDPILNCDCRRIVAMESVILGFKERILGLKINFQNLKNKPINYEANSDYDSDYDSH
jgi:hypothetical protein